MATALINGRVVLPTEVRSDLCVVIDDGRIAAIGEDAPDNVEQVDLDGQLLLPGLIDVQINGGGGRLFNDDPSVETIAVMAAAHRRFGTTGLLPTPISDDFPGIQRALTAMDEAIESGVPGVLGIHKIGRASCRGRV